MPASWLMQKQSGRGRQFIGSKQAFYPSILILLQRRCGFDSVPALPVAPMVFSIRIIYVRYKRAQLTVMPTPLESTGIHTNVSNRKNLFEPTIGRRGFDNYRFFIISYCSRTVTTAKIMRFGNVVFHIGLSFTQQRRCRKIAETHNIRHSTVVDIKYTLSMVFVVTFCHFQLDFL